MHCIPSEEALCIFLSSDRRASAESMGKRLEGIMARTMPCPQMWGEARVSARSATKVRISQIGIALSIFFLPLHYLYCACLKVLSYKFIASLHMYSIPRTCVLQFDSYTLLMLGRTPKNVSVLHRIRPCVGNLWIALMLSQSYPKTPVMNRWVSPTTPPAVWP